MIIGLLNSQTYPTDRITEIHQNKLSISLVSIFYHFGSNLISKIISNLILIHYSIHILPQSTCPNFYLVIRGVIVNSAFGGVKGSGTRG